MMRIVTATSNGTSPSMSVLLTMVLLLSISEAYATVENQTALVEEADQLGC